MEQTAASTIAAKAKGLGAVTTHTDSGGVVICFAQHDSRAKEIGHVCLDVTAEVINLAEVRVSECPLGNAWYRDISRKVHLLDQTRAQVC
jgi:hypothetical protein